jgi:hypothetical protein
MIVVAVAMGFATLGQQADAGLIIDVSQVSNNVVVAGSGSTDPTVLTVDGDGGLLPWLGGAEGWATVGPLGGGDIFALAGPLSFGTGVVVGASSATGDTFGLEATTNGFGSPVLFLPFGYAAGTELSGTATYDNTTIAALGLTPGAYTYTATGVNGALETVLTVNIGSVPEPSSLTMAATAVGLLGGLAFRRGRRIKG